MFNVCGIGLNSIDIIIPIRDNYSLKTIKTKCDSSPRLVGGGEVANCLCACSQMGLSCNYIGAFGNDYFGRLSRSLIKKAGVNLKGSIIVNNCSNQIGFILNTATKKQSHILWYRDQLLESSFSMSDDMIDVISHSDLLYLDGHFENITVKACNIAAKKKITIVMDAERWRDSCLEYLSNIDVLIGSQRFSLEAMSAFNIESVEKLLSFLNSKYNLIVSGITFGEEGSIFLTKEGSYIYTKALKTDVVDSTGAGDLFHAGYIYGSFNGLSVSKCINLATACGSLACREHGGRIKLPSIETIFELSERVINFIE